jgi:hypothetical protein
MQKDGTHFQPVEKRIFSDCKIASGSKICHMSSFVTRSSPDHHQMIQVLEGTPNRVNSGSFTDDDLVLPG